MERERGISITSSVLQFPLPRAADQPARHARPRRLQRGHLPHARWRPTAPSWSSTAPRASRPRPRSSSASASSARSRSSPSSTRWTARAASRSASWARSSSVLGIGAVPMNWPVRVGPTSAASTTAARAGHLFDPGTHGRTSSRRRSATSTIPTARSCGRGGATALRAEVELLDVAGERLRPRAVPARGGHAGVLRQRLSQLRVRAVPRRVLRAEPPRRARAGASDGPVAPDRAGFRRLRLQDPGEHGPAPPRPRRLPARLRRPLRARHGRHQRPHRRARSAWHAAPPLRPGPRDHRGGVPRRHHRPGHRGDSASATRSAPARRCARGPAPVPPECFAVLRCTDTGRRKQFTKGSGSSSRRG